MGTEANDRYEHVLKALDKFAERPGDKYTALREALPVLRILSNPAPAELVLPLERLVVGLVFGADCADSVRRLLLNRK